MKYWYKLLMVFNKNVYKNRFSLGLTESIQGLTFKEIQTILIGFNVVVYNKNNEGYMAKFTSFHTEYILSFTSNDKVKHIELELWKDMDVKFGKGV